MWAILVVGLASPVVESPSFSAETQWAAWSACVRLRFLESNSVGTGVVVGRRDQFYIVMTANHTIPRTEGLEVQVFNRDNPSEPAILIRGVRLLWNDENIDVALFAVPAKGWSVKPIPIADHRDLPKRGSMPVLSIGCTEGNPPSCRVENLIAKRLLRRPTGVNRFVWETNSASIPGRSGGPLIDLQGRVIGICSGTQEGKGYYAHGDEIHAGLKQAGFGWLIRPE